MRKLLLPAIFTVTVGYVLAHFVVLFSNPWYDAPYFWLKVGLLTPLLAVAFGLALLSSWRWPWLCLGVYWIALSLGWWIDGHVLDLRSLTFAGGLNNESAFLWPVTLTLVVYGNWINRKHRSGRIKREREVSRELRLRYRLKRMSKPIDPLQPTLDPPVEPDDADGVVTADATAVEAGTSITCDNQPLVLLALAGLLALVAALGLWGSHNGGSIAWAADGVADSGTSADEPTRYSEAQAAPEPAAPVRNRHDDLTDASPERRWPAEPGWPNQYPVPMHLRAALTSWLVIENWQDGRIYGVGTDGSEITEIGQVLAPVNNVNRQGFTASGWAMPGTVCATAVNAIHLKTDHDYENGRGVIFSLLPIEFATFDPASYKSYFNQSSSLFTDIRAGTGIFGGTAAPLVGSRLLLAPRVASEPWRTAVPVETGWVPQLDQVIVIEVVRRKYNPEWIEFENRFGGIIWIKELGLDPYPIGQVLKPVAGTGRFQGSTAAEIGRIRANHPGVLCISTSPLGLVGGFQIIPRDHAMSSEMNIARLRTQWMVVGPLWALDPSWEGVPPLFTDYFYPAYTPALNDDYSVNDEVSGAAVFLDRFTVRGRYRDAEDPEEYILLRKSVYYDDDALVNLSHLRIYFPRG